MTEEQKEKKRKNKPRIKAKLRLVSGPSGGNQSAVFDRIFEIIRIKSDWFCPNHNQ